MRNSEARKQLEDAVALLTMLEQLTEGCEKEPNAATRLTWRGLRLSIEQSKRLVVQTLSGAATQTERVQPLRSSQGRAAPLRESKASESASAMPSADQGVEHAASVSSQVASSQVSSSLVGSSLAGRIAKAPTGRGRVRELGAGGADADRSSEVVSGSESKVRA